MKTLKKLTGVLALALLASLSWSVGALASETYRLTTGSLGGTYHDVLGVNLRNILRENGIGVEVLESRGSIQNLDRIHDGDADIGFTQADALAGWLRTKPAAEIDILGSLGNECIFMVVHKDSGIEDIGDFTDGSLKIAVGERGTGSAQSWDFIRTLNTDYAEPQVYYQGGIRAMGQVQTGNLDAFLWVTSPNNRQHRFLEAVLIDNSPFRFVNFDDRSLASTLPNGQDVYTTEEVKGREGVRFFGGDEKINTLCTGLTVVADYHLESRVLEEVATSVMMNSNRIVGN